MYEITIEIVKVLQISRFSTAFFVYSDVYFAVPMEKYIYETV